MKEFAFFVFVTVLVLLILAIRKHGIRWFKTEDGKRILFGLIAAPVIAVLIALVGGCSTLEVFAGLERTRDISPMCDPGGADDKMTSNIGMEGCKIISDDKRTTLCGVMRHHSCAISQDKESYDSIGFFVKRKIF